MMTKKLPHVQIDLLDEKFVHLIIYLPLYYPCIPALDIALTFQIVLIFIYDLGKGWFDLIVLFKNSL